MINLHQGEERVEGGEITGASTPPPWASPPSVATEMVQRAWPPVRAALGHRNPVGGCHSPPLRVPLSRPWHPRHAARARGRAAGRWRGGGQPPPAAPAAATTGRPGPPARGAVPLDLGGAAAAAPRPRCRRRRVVHITS